LCRISQARFLANFLLVDHIPTISDRPSGNPLFLATRLRFMQNAVFIKDAPNGSSGWSGHNDLRWLPCVTDSSIPDVPGERRPCIDIFAAPANPLDNGFSTEPAR
jgi:hypothetical protein